MASAKVDLFRVTRVLNWMLVAATVGFFVLGWQVSFWFHFLTVTFLLLTVMNLFYRFVQTQHAILRNFGVLARMIHEHRLNRTALARLRTRSLCRRPSEMESASIPRDGFDLGRESVARTHCRIGSTPWFGHNSLCRRGL